MISKRVLALIWRQGAQVCLRSQPRLHTQEGAEGCEVGEVAPFPPKAFHSNSSSQWGAVGDLRAGLPGSPPSSGSLTLLHSPGQG